MKIIHTADIHLDSPLSQVKDSAARRYELLLSLSKLAEYADNNGVKAVIIAGDLFDNQYATDSTVASVADIINRSNAAWFVLQGNHASSVPYEKLKVLSPQISLFGSDWSYYNIGNVTICGRELGNNDEDNYTRLALDDSRYNIVVLHGDIDDRAYGLIDVKRLSQSRANYIALGHRHTLAQYSFGNIKACYCGALEPRGFDEPQRTGFIVIDTDKDKLTFVEQHIRRIESVTVDVGGISSDIDLNLKISEAVSGVDTRNYLNVIFCGAIDGDIHLNIVANNALSDKFFALRIEDRTTTAYNLKSLRSEMSLRGEFIKLTDSIEDESLKAAVIKMGLKVLSGEDIV